jgi:hypothetical protein
MLWNWKHVIDTYNLLCKNIAHTLLYTTVIDHVTLETKSIVARQIIIGYWKPKLPTCKAGSNVTEISLMYP